MSTHRIHRDGRTLTVSVGMIEVTTMGPDYEPDPLWSHIDRSGHTHMWVGGKLPTLVQRHRDWIDDDGDSRSDSWRECIECGEEVAPGYVVRAGYMAGARNFVPGLRSYELDGVPVSEEEAQRFIATLTPGTITIDEIGS